MSSLCDDRSHVFRAKGSTCLVSIFPSIAINLIAAVSATKPLPSATADIPEATGNEPLEQVPMDVQLSLDPTRDPQPPKAKGRRRPSQSKTSYQLAHPPPAVKHRQRLKIRPRILLQLQQISSNTRPTPVIDVLPHILFAPRLARRVPQIFQGKQGLGFDDLVFVRSQTQGPTQDGLFRGGEQAGSSDQDIIAAICNLKQGSRNGSTRTEIRFSNGTSWSAIALSSGAYELVSQKSGDSQSIARWVPKREAKREGGLNPQNPCKNSSQNFKFSLMDAGSRRHPVIANMSRQCIDIYDRYSIPLTPRSPHQNIDVESIDSAGCEDNAQADSAGCDEYCRAIIETDDELRTIIAITGIWVAFCEGWSPDFQYSTKQVISNGFSELSNRRRSTTAQPIDPATDEPHHPQLEPSDRWQYRPGVVRISSLSSVPSSPSLGSPKRRTVSSSATGFHDHYARRHPPSATGYQPSTPIPDISSDMEHEDPRSNQLTDAVLEEKLGVVEGVQVHDGRRVFVRANKVPRAAASLGNQSGQDVVSEATLVEHEGKGPSRLRRLIGRLRRTRTTH
ncbi:MAG: hypothetical protein L6R39_004651 [Caloplaca ligustica]|nr:MAG: hypothetical protein L6R39_004651 [Caloplaca ligustica]